MLSVAACQEDTAFGVPLVGVAYKAISVPHCKYREREGKDGLEPDKSGKMFRVH
jgi:hypothetical protein